MDSFDRYLLRAWIKDAAALCAVVIFAAGLIEVLNVMEAMR
jgi:hypothetical protein